MISEIAKIDLLLHQELTLEETQHLIKNKLKIDFKVSSLQEKEIISTLLYKIKSGREWFESYVKESLIGKKVEGYQLKYLEMYEKQIVCKVFNISDKKVPIKNIEEYMGYFFLEFPTPFYSSDEFCGEYVKPLLLVNKKTGELIVRKFTGIKSEETIRSGALGYDYYIIEDLGLRNNNEPYEYEIKLNSNAVVFCNFIKDENIFKESRKSEYSKEFSLNSPNGLQNLSDLFSKKDILFAQTGNTYFNVYYSKYRRQIILCRDFSAFEIYQKEKNHESIRKFKNYLKDNSFKDKGYISCEVWRIMGCSQKDYRDLYKHKNNVSEVTIELPENSKLKITNYCRTSGRKKEHSFLPNKSVEYNEFIVIDIM